MKISPAQAALLSARERQLLETNGPYEIKQLVSLIKRTRELRDKQRDLTQRQRVAATGRSQSKASATVVRTQKKEQMFSRALTHYEGQLEKINQQCASAMRELSLGDGPAAPGKAQKTAGAKAGKAAATKRAGDGKARGRQAARQRLKSVA